MRQFIAIAPVLVLAGCGDGAPDHHYVLCEDKDGAGWTLINHQRDGNGYILACTYRSPDRQRVYTARCTEKGCS